MMDDNELRWASVYKLLGIEDCKDDLPVDRIYKAVQACPGVIHHMNSEHNTLLHLLAVNIGKNIYLADAVKEQQHQDGLLENVRLILQLGADPNAKNCQGDTPLCCLLARRGLHSGGLPVVIRAIEHLLTSGASPGSFSRCPPLVTVAKYLKYIFGSNLMASGELLIKLFEVLLRHGANPNVVDSDGYPPVLHILQLCLTNFLAARDPFCSKSAFQSFLVDYIDNLLCLFLKHGLDPNCHIQYRKSPIDIWFRTTYVAELIYMLCDESVHWEVIVFRHGLCQLLRTFISHGTDLGSMDLCRVCVHPLANIKFGCTLTELLAFRLVDTINDPDEGLAVWRFIKLMIRGMSCHKQQLFMKGLLQNLHREQIQNSHTLFSKLLQRRLETPSTLQELCRVAVSCALRWRLAENSDILKLPTPLALCLVTVGDAIVKPDVSITPYSHIRIKDSFLWGTNPRGSPAQNP